VFGRVMEEERKVGTSRWRMFVAGRVVIVGGGIALAVFIVVMLGSSSSDETRRTALSLSKRESIRHGFTTSHGAGEGRW
jgi:hypothetical protein